MTYRTLEEILDAKARALTALQARTGNLDEVQGCFRPAGGGWSTAEILEHLLIVETQLLRMTMTLLKRAEGTGAPVTGHSFAVDVDGLLERSRREKYATREGFQPSGTISVTTALTGLSELQGVLRKLQPRLLAADPTQSTFPHWIFGPLDLAQWLAFLVLHEERHLRQIEALTEGADFPGRS